MIAKDVIETIEKLAPLHLAMDWDNPGLILGNEDKQVQNILLALDIDELVINEAISHKIDMIITHHPIIYKAVKNINSRTTVGRWMLKLIQHDITVYTAHTNLDITEGGVNDTLFNRLGLTDKTGLQETTPGHYLGRVGKVVGDHTLKSYSEYVAKQLEVDIVRYVGDPDAKVHHVAICGGAASDYDMFKAAAKAGADLYITGDIRYHETQRAQGLGLNLIDATHHGTENLALADLKTYLDTQLNKNSNKGISILLSEVDLQPFKKA